MRRLFSVLSAAVVLGTVACGGSSDSTAPPPPTPPDIMHIQFASSLGVNISAMTVTSSGLYFFDDTVGTGAVARAPQRVTVHYTGWLPNGTKFDSSLDRNQPFAFQLGAGSVIAGWDEGVAGMAIGGTRTLVVPPSLGYGPVANGPIPANSVMVFRIKLLSAQ